MRHSKTVLFFVSFPRNAVDWRASVLVRVLIALGENVSAFSPSFSLGRGTSRGRSSGYGEAWLFGQRAPTPPANLSAQGMPALVPAAALESALLPRSGMPTAGSPVAGGAAASQTSPGHSRQSSARPSREGAPPANEDGVSDRCEVKGYVGAWSHGRKFFSPPLCNRPGCHEHPARSTRNPARYCCPACYQAVRNVQDRERKWLSRGTLDGRKKRAIEYQAAARRRRALGQHHFPHPASSQPPPGG